MGQLHSVLATSHPTCRTFPSLIHLRHKSTAHFRSSWTTVLQIHGKSAKELSSLLPSFFPSFLFPFFNISHAVCFIRDTVKISLETSKRELGLVLFNFSQSLVNLCKLEGSRVTKWPWRPPRRKRAYARILKK